MLRITSEQKAALALDYQRRLGDRLAVAFGRPDLGDYFRGLVAEAVAAGLKSERHIAEFAGLLLEIDRTGPRPKPVRERIADAEVDDPELKLFQVRYAWREAQGLAA